MAFRLALLLRSKLLHSSLINQKNQHKHRQKTIREALIPPMPMSTSSSSRRLAVLAIPGALLALTAAAGVWWWSVGSESSEQGDNHDIVTFTEAALAFRLELRKAEIEKKGALLAAFTEVRSYQKTLQLLAQRQEQQSSSPGDVGAQILEAKHRLAKKVLEAGELLTQYMMKLDELPVGGCEVLRAYRKELLAEAGQLEKELDSVKA